MLPTNVFPNVCIPIASATEEIHDVIPAAETVADYSPEDFRPSVLGLTEMLLKDPDKVDFLARLDQKQIAEMIPRSLAIALIGFSVFSLTLAMMLNLAPESALPLPLKAGWSGQAVATTTSLWLAYTVGMVAAAGVCLPCFYFYSLLAGVRITMLQVTGNMMKSMAATSIMLMGLMPIYVALVLGATVFKVPAKELQLALNMGLALPFVAGLWGTHSVYVGFMSLADTLPPERRYKRFCFLRRLTFSCAAVMTAVTPVMIYTLWNFFAQRLA